MSAPLCRVCGDAVDGCGSCVRWKEKVADAYASGFKDAKDAAAKVADDSVAYMVENRGSDGRMMGVAEDIADAIRTLEPK